MPAYMGGSHVYSVHGVEVKRLDSGTVIVAVRGKNDEYACEPRFYSYPEYTVTGRVHIAIAMPSEEPASEPVEA